MYSDRRVTLFRVFDPKRAAARAVDVLADSAYEDLNAHLDLIVRTGYIDQDGTAAVFARSAGNEAVAGPRSR
jgi:hypothetical protein